MWVLDETQLFELLVSFPALSHRYSNPFLRDWLTPWQQPGKVFNPISSRFHGLCPCLFCIYSDFGVAGWWTLSYIDSISEFESEAGTSNCARTNTQAIFSSAHCLRTLLPTWMVSKSSTRCTCLPCIKFGPRADLIHHSHSTHRRKSLFTTALTFRFIANRNGSTWVLKLPMFSISLTRF
jgi:hypothetical protein